MKRIFTPDHQHQTVVCYQS